MLLLDLKPTTADALLLARWHNDDTGGHPPPEDCSHHHLLQGLAIRLDTDAAEVMSVVGGPFIPTGHRSGGSPPALVGEGLSKADAVERCHCDGAIRVAILVQGGYLKHSAAGHDATLGGDANMMRGGGCIWHGGG